MHAHITERAKERERVSCVLCIDSVFVFVGVFWYLEAGMLTAPQLLVMCLVMSMLLVLLWVLLLFLTNHTSAGLLGEQEQLSLTIAG